MFAVSVEEAKVAEARMEDEAGLKRRSDGGRRGGGWRASSICPIWKHRNFDSHDLASLVVQSRPGVQTRIQLVDVQKITSLALLVVQDSPVDVQKIQM